MSYFIKGLGEANEWGRHVLDVTSPDARTYAVYFANENDLVDLVAEFQNYDDAVLFVEVKDL